MNAMPMTQSHELLAPLSVAELVQRLASFDCSLTGDGQVRLTGIFQDSRKLEPGGLFVARAGAHFDGTRYVGDAVRRGAVAVLSDQPPPELCPLPWIQVQDLSQALGFAAHAVYGDPSHDLPVVGVTGTNGKTTTVSILEQALTSLGERPARLGTLGFAFLGKQSAGGLTTPQADDTARLLAGAARQGATQLLMEVSSHALAQGRVNGLRFAVGAFSNLTQDHLDFHSTFEEYRAAKRRLFSVHRPRVNVINVDDAFGLELAREFSALTVSSRGQAELWVRERALGAQGISAVLATPEGDVSIESGLLGEHNLDNLLLCCGIALALGIPLCDMAAALRHVESAPGRLERCSSQADDVVVLVDYAHTPDALERALLSARNLGQRLTCVFGCGGDRDRGKRPLMGGHAGRLADRVFVTNDNPRSEAPAAIAEQIEQGLLAQSATFERVLDRSEAIRRAVAEAEPGEVILIAGKGHEPYQLIGSQVLDFDDREQARVALRKRRGAP